MDPTDLRQAALELLKERPEDSDTLNHRSPVELIHELRVHQAELEMQNEELRRAQLELEESRDRFANLFDFAPVGYVTLDSSNRIVEANLTLAKMLGVARGMLVGQTLSQYATPDATQLGHHLDAINATDQKVSCELTLKKADGSPVLVRLDSISVEGGKCSIGITFLSDDEALLRAKRDSDERLRVICHALPIPIAYADRSEAYQFNNAAHEAWFKVSREAIAGRRVQEVMGDAIYELVEPRIKRVLAGHACSCVMQLPGGDLGTRSAEVHYAPHFDASNEVVGFYELLFDVSASLQVKEQLARIMALEAQLQVLSSRQRSVFNLLLAGSSNKVIAVKLNVGARTVERERHEILRLLGVETINDLLVKFAGLADSDDEADA